MYNPSLSSAKENTRDRPQFQTVTAAYSHAEEPTEFTKAQRGPPRGIVRPICKTPTPSPQGSESLLIIHQTKEIFCRQYREADALVG